MITVEHVQFSFCIGITTNIHSHGFDLFVYERLLESPVIAHHRGGNLESSHLVALRGPRDPYRGVAQSFSIGAR